MKSAADRQVGGGGGVGGRKDDLNKWREKAMETGAGIKAVGQGAQSADSSRKKVNLLLKAKQALWEDREKCGGLSGQVRRVRI